MCIMCSKASFLIGVLCIVFSTKLCGASTLSSLFDNLANISYHCLSSNEPCDITEKSREPILKTVDCSLPGARWDYQIKVSLLIEVMTERKVERKSQNLDDFNN